MPRKILLLLLSAGGFWAGESLNSERIKIVIDYANIRGGGDEATVLKEIVFPSAIGRIAPWLKVVNPSPARLIAMPIQFTCGVPLLTSSSSQTEQAGHLIVFPYFVEDQRGSYLASSMPCFAEEEDGRPRIGVMGINKPNIMLGEQPVEMLIHHITHELIHLLMFDTEIYTRSPLGINFVAVNVTSGDQTVTKFVGPNIIEWGKAHFKCESFDGILAEDEEQAGQNGNHFEKVLAGNELMTATFTERPVISKLTMAVFQDSGWYDVDFSQAEPNKWGKDAGCDFLKIDCDASRFDEFCSGVDEVFCANDFRTKTRCVRNQFTNGCFVKVPSIGHDCAIRSGASRTFDAEYFGAYSRCFPVHNMNLVVAGCFMSFCSDDLKRLYIVSPKSTYLCKEGDTIRFSYYTVKCPAPQDFCAFADMNRCPDDCSGNGYCNYRNQCICTFAYEGENCKTLKRWDRVIGSALYKTIVQSRKDDFDMSTLSKAAPIAAVLAAFVLALAW